jgi:uncharacterized damage-inducible protein DinB
MSKVPVLIGALVATLAVSGHAQETLPGHRGELLARLDDAATKLDQLAAAIPQEKYGWRPGPGVRSVSEVLLHVAVINYGMMTAAGLESPMPLSSDLETSLTDAAQVRDFLRRSFAHVRTGLRALAERDLDKPTEMFDGPTTYLNVYLRTVVHCHEHLGQLVAYARMNGIVPPWSK